MKYDGYLITGLPPIHGLSIEMIKLDAKPLVGHLQRLNRHLPGEGNGYYTKESCSHQA